MSRFEVYLSWSVMKFVKVMGFYSLLWLSIISFVFFILCVKYSPSIFDIIPLIISAVLYGLVGINEKFPFNDNLKKWYIVYHLHDADIISVENGFTILFPECNVFVQKTPFIKVEFNNIFSYNLIMDDEIATEICDYVEHRYHDRISNKELVALLQSAIKVIDNSCN